MAKMEVPGFKEQDAKLKTEKIKDTEKKEFLKMQLKKLGAIFKQTSKKDSAFVTFVHNFAAVQTIAFLTGSMAFLFSGRTQYTDNYGDTKGGLFNNPLNEIYGDNMSYGQAIKNAYLLEDWRNGEGGVFQGVCGLLSMVIALSLATVAGAKKVKSNLIKSKDILLQLDHLKDYGIDAQKLIQEMEPFIAKLVSKMSEKDRGYFDNLLAGGLSKADYKTCIDIISGHLKSNPEDYNQLVAIIDENTLPESIKKKYGKGKTISFGAAQAMMQNTKD